MGLQDFDHLIVAAVQLEVEDLQHSWELMFVADDLKEVPPLLGRAELTAVICLGNQPGQDSSWQPGQNSMTVTEKTSKSLLLLTVTADKQRGCGAFDLIKVQLYLLQVVEAPPLMMKIRVIALVDVPFLHSASPFQANSFCPAQYECQALEMPEQLPSIRKKDQRATRRC